MTFADAYDRLPLVAILRGVQPHEVVEVGEALVAEGVELIEVPMNSPQPLESVRRLAVALRGRAVIGAGTVLSPEVAEEVAQAGGMMIISPDTRPRVIERTVDMGLVPLPGFATPSEAFRAYDAGARHLKLFPASTYGPSHVGALRAVLPVDARLLAVGGVGPAVMTDWWRAGVRGFGLGSEIYRPGVKPDAVRARAAAAVETLRAAMQEGAPA